MGLFSKKTVTCKRCGKNYEAVITGDLCPECQDIIWKKENEVHGYKKCLRKNFTWEDEEEMDAIINHREQIWKKYEVKNGITKEELAAAGANFKKLSDDEALDIAVRLNNCCVIDMCPDILSDSFIVPAIYRNTILDLDDVFAVGYTRGKVYAEAGAEKISCVLYTNDPYLPIVPFVIVGTIRFFQLKSKSGRGVVEDVFTEYCSNLQYPVQELRKLKKQIKAEGSVRGDIDIKVMLDSISDAINQVGIYKARKVDTDLKKRDAMSYRYGVEKRGYVFYDEAKALLRADKMFGRKFWAPYLAIASWVTLE